MDQVSSDQADIKVELYRKNVELLNANNTLELVHDLDDLMIESKTVEEVAQKFIDKICSKLGFVEGVVAVTEDGSGLLKVVGMTQEQDSQKAVVKELDEVCTTHQEKIIKGEDGRLRLVYPILIGGLCLGCYVVATPLGLETPTEFEKTTFIRLATVFGLAIDRVRINQKLREAQERELKRVLELDRMKDEFISIASHELKSPATVVKNYLWSAINSKSQSSEMVLSDLNKAYQANLRLVVLVNDLLDVSRIEGGGIEIVPEKFDLSILVKETVGEYYPRAMDKLLKLSGSLPETALLVNADKNKIHQVLANLIDNAIKFTPIGGSVIVEVRAVDDKVWVSVADTGIGIAPDNLPKLFLKFGRVDTIESGVGRTQGTGLGLYVSKKLVEISGGEMTLDSGLGKGSIFKFSLPQAS